MRWGSPTIPRIRCTAWSDKDRYATRAEVETFESLGAVRVESMAPITKQVAALA